MKISVIIMLSAIILWSFGCGYWLGKGHQKIEYITKEIEVVKTVSKKKAVIQARPHIDRDTALKLMYDNKL